MTEVPLDRDPSSDPFFYLEAHNLEELVEGLKRLNIDPDDLKVTPPKKRQAPRLEPDPGAPERPTPDVLREVADSIPDPLLTPRLPEVEGPPLSGEGLRGVTPTALAKGAALRRFRNREARLIQREAAYFYLHQAVHAQEPEERRAAVEALESLAEAQKLGRVAQVCAHLMTRRQAVEALTRLQAVLALEDVALFTRPPEPPAPRGEAAQQDQETVRRRHDEGYDEIQNLAVDKVAELSDAGVPGALEALIRLARYDYSRHGYAQFHAVRRLSERVAALEERHDIDALVLTFHQSKSPRARKEILEYFRRNLDRLRDESCLDAVHLLLEYDPESAVEAERVLAEVEAS